jgi:hypothetical protein
MEVIQEKTLVMIAAFPVERKGRKLKAQEADGVLKQSPLIF